MPRTTTAALARRCGRYGFVGGLLLNDRDTAIVRLLIDLAHNINIKVTAEGIETDEQRQALLSLGCTCGQGYHLGRPAAAEVAAAELRYGTRAAAVQVAQAPTLGSRAWDGKIS
jgi:predicted signal transduction protein with EAL and GGDEF domain